MSITKLNTELDELKKQYHFYKDEVENKRQEIAEFLCPFKIGDELIIKEDTTVIRMEIDTIHYYIDLLDQALTEMGKETTWQVAGGRINKTTGKVGKWRKSINPKFWDINRNVCTPKDLNTIFMSGSWNDLH